MKLNKVCKWLLLGTISVLLTACNSGESDSSVGNSQSQAQQVTLSADNTVDSITNGLESYVSLEDKIHATSSVGDNTVSEVVLLSDQPACRDIDVYPSGYSVNSTGYIGTCVYEYTVENTVDSTARAVAYSTTIVQEEATGSIEQFERLAETAEASQVLAINLADKLLGQIPVGYALSETITNLGVGSASLDIMNETITFISDEPGYSQIIYSYASETEVKVGSITIAVSSELNTAPVAPNIDYSADINNETVNINTEVTIDVGSDISDPDDEPLQLVYVDSWYASVAPFDLSDESNTAFTFNTDRAGEHFVTYAISDHNGGYDIGQVRIEVYDPNSVASWGNIQQGLQLFYGPLTHAEAFGQGVMDTSTNFDQNRTVSTFNYADAKKSCESKGGLPSEAQLQELYDLSKPQSQGWPVTLSYWSNDVNKVVSLSNKQSSVPVGSDTYYVTCVNEGGFAIDSELSSTTDVIANGGSTNDGIAKVVVKLTFNQQPVSGEIITGGVPNDTQANLDVSTVTTDENGIATFGVTDIKAETVTFTAGYNGEERNIDISFIGDKSTANITAEVTVNNALLNDGSNEITATLKDYFENGVQGESVVFSSDDADVKITPVTSITDFQGSQSAQIEWIGSQTITSDPNIMITSSYLRPDGEQIFVNDYITFSTAVFDGLFIDVNNQLISTGKNKVHAKVSLSNGSPAIGIPVTFSSSSTCSTGYSGEKVINTNEQGIVNITLTSSTVGNCQVTAKALGESDSVTVTFKKPEPKVGFTSTSGPNSGAGAAVSLHGYVYAYITPKSSGEVIRFQLLNNSASSANSTCRFMNGSSSTTATTESNGRTPTLEYTRTNTDKMCYLSVYWGNKNYSNWLIMY